MTSATHPSNHVHTSQGAYKSKRARRRSYFRPLVEPLEDRTAPAITVQGIPDWVAQGPAPIYESVGQPTYQEGAINAIAVEPGNANNANNIYIASVNGGVWRTTSGMSDAPTWKALTDFLPSLAIGTLAISPLDPSVVFAGTPGFTSDVGFSDAAVGLFRTSDRGSHWTHIDAGLPPNTSGQWAPGDTAIFRIVPTDILDSSTFEEVVLVATQNGIYRSTDGGDHFDPVKGPDGQNFSSPTTDLVEVHVLVSVQPVTIEAWFFAGVPGQGILRSTDGGLHWSADHVNSGIPNDLSQLNPPENLSQTTNVRLAVHDDPSNPALYAMLADGGDKLVGVYRSTLPNQGDFWSPLRVPSTLPSDEQASIDHSAFAADPNSPNVVYFGGYAHSTVWVCDASITDPNSRWTAITVNGTGQHADLRAFAFDANGDLLSADDGGIYRLKNTHNPATRTWVSLNTNLQITEVEAIAYDNHNHILVGGAQDNGIFYQNSPSALQWTEPEDGIGDGWGPEAVDNLDATKVRWYAGGNAPLERRDYSTGTLPPLKPTATISGGDWLGLTVNQTKAGHILVTWMTPDSVTKQMVGHLYESPDPSQPLAEITSELGIPLSWVNRVAYRGDRAYVCGTDQKGTPVILLQESPGATFKQLNYYSGTKGKGSRAWAFAIDPDDLGTAYVVDQNRQVWQVINAGSSDANQPEQWTNITGNLNTLTGKPPLHRMSAVIVKDGTTKVLLVGDSNGVYRIFNPQAGVENTVWTRYGDKLPFAQTSDLLYDANDKLLAVATMGRGVWAIPAAADTLATVGTLNIASESVAGQNYSIFVSPDPDHPGFVYALIGGQNRSIPASCLSQIVISGGLGNDTINIDLPFPNIAVRVDGGSGHETINVQELGAGSTVTVDGNGAARTINVSPDDKNLTKIQGSIYVTGTSGSNQVNVYDDNYTGSFLPGTSYPVPDAYTIAVAGVLQVSRVPGFALIAGTVAGSSVTNLKLSVGPDPYAYVNVAPIFPMTTDLTVSGASHVNLGSATVPLDFIQGPVHILDTTASWTALTVDDSANHVTPRNATIATALFLFIPVGAISGFAPKDIGFEPAGVNSVTLKGGSAGNTFTFINNLSNLPNLKLSLNSGLGDDLVNVQDIAAALDINGQDGQDTVNVGNNGSLGGILAPVTVKNDNNLTDLSIDGSADGSPESNVTLATSSLNGLAPATISWLPGDLASLTIHGGSKGNTINVTGTPDNGRFQGTTLYSGLGTDTVTVHATGGALTINGQNGADTVTIGDNHSLAKVNGPVAVQNTSSFTALIIDDAADTSPWPAIHLGASSLTGMGPTINWVQDDLSSLAIDGGSNTKTYFIDDTPSGRVSNMMTLLNTGTGDNTVAVQNASGPLTIHGGGPDPNTLEGPNTDNTWVLTGPTSGTLNGNITFSNIQKLVGGSGNDTFQVVPGATFTGTIDGGVAGPGSWNAPSAPGKWLDYSAWTTGVTVNLTAGIATGLSGNISNIQNVLGGAGGDKLIGGPSGGVLVGGAGSDTLQGGAGRSILIGGNGNDQITGGPGDDIVIAGTTTYDTNKPALLLLLAEWQRTDLFKPGDGLATYGWRVANLGAGVGPNQYKLVWGTTVLDDGGSDVLRGDPANTALSPSELDWFFANLAAGHDTIADLKTGELVNISTIAAPTPIGPSGQVISLTPTFSWSNVPNADSYEIWVNDGTSGQWKSLLDQIVTGTSWTPTTPLIMGHSYRWWVRGVNSNSGLHGLWSDPVDFTLVPVATPTLIAPSGLTTTLTPTFTWNSALGADHYEIWVNNVTGGPGIKVFDQTVTGTAWTAATALNPGFKYIWWVRAINSNGVASPWSGGLSFKAEPVATPTLIGPGGSATGPSTPKVTFSWNRVPGAGGYDIWVSDLTSGQALRNQNINDISWTPSSLLVSAHTYRWWLRAYDPSGHFGLWSNPLDFTVAALTAPAPVAPGASNTGLKPTFTWKPVPWADHYDVFVQDLTGRRQALRDQNVGETSWTLPSYLSPGDSYRWWLRAVAADGVGGPWSTPLDFTTIVLLAPTPVGPTGPNSSSTPTFTWNSVANADHYRIWVDNLTTGQSQVLSDQNVPGISWTPATTLAAGDSYRWWASAAAVDGGSGPWSTTMVFTVAAPAAPALIVPNGRIFSPIPNFMWTAVPGADHYELWVQDLTWQAPTLHAVNVIGTSWQATSPLPQGDSFRWWVRAVGPDGVGGAWSAPLDCAVLGINAPTVIGPSGANTSLTPTFTWNAVVNADHYDLWVDDLTAGQSQAVRNEDVGGTSWTPTTPLIPGHSYRWWVRVVAVSELLAQTADGPWSAGLTFTAAPLTAPIQVGPSGTIFTATPLFTWNAVLGADHYDLWVDDLSTHQSQVVRASHVTGISWSPTNNLNWNRYRWWVRAIASDGNSGPWSAAMDFLVTLGIGG
jgi:hypothetical protein